MHPNLPRVLDYIATPDQKQYLVMDYIKGKNLNQFLAESPGGIPEEQAIEWITQICDALAYLHNQDPPIIHRDVKPANIIITETNLAILVDFGISKIFRADSSTTIGARRLTSGYAPPEQYGMLNSRTDRRSDVYALGATLYTLLTGRRPPEAIERIANSIELIPPRQLNPSIHPHVERAILKAMQLPIAERFQDVASFKLALRQKNSLPTKPATIPSPSPSHKPVASSLSPTTSNFSVRRWLLFVALTGLFMTILFGGISFGNWVLSNDETPSPIAVVTRQKPTPKMLLTFTPVVYNTPSRPTRTPTPVST
ncbi:MAG: serine/threonine protein kinase, partial [Caldilineae bacterium]